jgi:acylphosphatase
MPKSDIVTRRYVVSGRVQGVGFRWATHQTAVEKGLSGWVRNLANGSVEIVAGGDEISLLGLEEWMKSGPRFARVDIVEKLLVEDKVSLPKPFKIK